jgi:uncharacterized membrane protein
VAEQGWNPWKMTAIGLGLVVITAVVTGVVVANWSGRDVERTGDTPSAATRPASTYKVSPSTSAPVAATKPATLPSQVAIDDCNRQAAAQSSQRSKTKEIVIDGAIGAVTGAVVGAAGGAIVGGGSGAGKGAAIGGILGAGGGALYGINENRKNDTQYRDAYASCMRSRGHVS